MRSSENRGDAKMFALIGGVVVILLVIVGAQALGLLSKPKTSSDRFAVATKDGEMVNADNIATESMDKSFANDSMTLKATLKDVTENGNSTGTAYVLRKDEKLTHSVTASLPDPELGSVYEGWLVKKLPTLQFFSTGVMGKNSEGAYEISFMSDQTYEGYDFVVVTLETVVDSVPETHILEGEAK